MPSRTKSSGPGLVLAPAGWKAGPAGLEREFVFTDFAAAMKFVQRVGREAEKAWHHPDIDIRWNRVTLRLISHDEGRITERDVLLATRFSVIGVSRNPVRKPS